MTNATTDCREEFLVEFGAKIATVLNNSDELSEIMSITALCLDGYELTKRTTDVGFHDGTSEHLLKLYAGTLLTAGKSKKTVYGYIRFLKRFYANINKQLSEVTTMDIRVWLAKMQETVSLRTCENYRSYLSAFYSWLYLEELIDKNPMAKIQPVKCIDKNLIAFTDIELDALRMVNSSVRDRAILEVLLTSGVRISELCALNISDVNFREKQIFVREGKGGKQRIVFINDVCIIYLKKYLRTRTDDFEPLFLTRNKTRLTTDSARDCLLKMGKASGVQDVHPHKCRRTFATAMYKKGMDVHSIQILMGHANINTTMTYIESDDQALKAEYRKYA